MKIGIVAGEDSGDQLGAGLMVALKKTFHLQCGQVNTLSNDSAPFDNLSFIGVGGQRMLAEGFESIAPMELLSVMGLVEPLKRLPSLLRLRRDLYLHFLEQQVDIVVGIDSPDFNLGLERRLKKAGITTCHYVCPSVWAWRQGRVAKIRESVDHVLTLLPFENKFLEQAGVPSTFVGHPVADKFSADIKFADDLSLSEDVRNPSLTDADCEIQGSQEFGGQERNFATDYAKTSDTFDGEITICVMPGSRHSELDRLLTLFLNAIKKVQSLLPSAKFILPASNPAIRQRVVDTLHTSDYRDIFRALTVVEGQSHEAILEADIVLLASGTAALEAGLLAKPMLVAYRLNWLTYQIAKKMVKVDRFSLPNLLLEKQVVPEYIQDDATADALADGLVALAHDRERRHTMRAELAKLMPMLAKNASATSASVVLNLATKH